MKLSGSKIAILVADMFEDLELWYPYYRLQEEEADVVIVGPKEGTFSGKRGLTARANKAVKQVKPADFDAVIIPGGYSPDYMRRSPEMVEFVKRMASQGSIVAAICHGPWMLASADLLRGKKITSFESIRVDLENAGAEWIDIRVATDGNIITSRRPDDLPAFCRAIICALADRKSSKGGA
jgi:protease I